MVRAFGAVLPSKEMVHSMARTSARIRTDLDRPARMATNRHAYANERYHGHTEDAHGDMPWVTCRRCCLAADGDRHRLSTASADGRACWLVTGRKRQTKYLLRVVLSVLV